MYKVHKTFVKYFLKCHKVLKISIFLYCFHKNKNNCLKKLVKTLFPNCNRQSAQFFGEKTERMYKLTNVPNMHFFPFFCPGCTLRSDNDVFQPKFRASDFSFVQNAIPKVKTNIFLGFAEKF